MGLIDQTQFVERLRFFEGEPLFASDLQEIEQFNREMRWLHNRSLHTFGIGRGYGVEGKQGYRQVTIGGGYAIDDLGREIVLMSPLVLAIPPVAGKAGASVFYGLSVAYPDDQTLLATPAESRQGVCGNQGVIRLRETPVFCWIPMSKTSGALHPSDAAVAKQISHGQRLLLATIEIRECQIQSIDISTRRDARCSAVPYVAGGRSKLILLKDDKRFLATVNTCNAAFAKTPIYTARLVAPHHFQGEMLTEFVLLTEQPTVMNSRVGGFEISFVDRGADRLKLLRASQAKAEHVELSKLDDIEVEWMGVEA